MTRYRSGKGVGSYDLAVRLSRRMGQRWAEYKWLVDKPLVPSMSWPFGRFASSSARALRSRRLACLEHEALNQTR
jgi:hypothetical protein